MSVAKLKRFYARGRETRLGCSSGEAPMPRNAKPLCVTLTALLTLIALAGTAIAGPLKDAPSKAPNDALATGRMEFTVQWSGGNCNGCEWVRAKGVIEAGITEKFKGFVARENPPHFVEFDSPGGNLLEALKLGRYLRVLGWDTSVGKNTVRTGRDTYVEEKSRCYSACVYAFAGGVHRSAEDKTIGIHQFYRLMRYGPMIRHSLLWIWLTCSS